MDDLIDFGYVVDQTQHGGPAGPRRDPGPTRNCTAHPTDPLDPDCQREYDDLE